MRILYIDIDTLRSDHLGCAGYHRNTTPNIDAIAANGVRFAKVYASDVPCLPSRTALISGMFGIRNGVVNHGGVAAELRPEGPGRHFIGTFASNSWASKFYYAGYHTASISSFPFRHSAGWWNYGFMEALNLMRGMGGERADEVLPSAHKWIAENGRKEDWFLHVHLWDPHTPYNTPQGYGNPFADDPIAGWHTEEVRARNWGLAGPHSAQEPWGFVPNEWGPPGPRQPDDGSSMDNIKGIIDGYDVGIRYADDAVGSLLDQLAGLGVLEDTAVLVSSDHGEAFGELGVYADHQGADEATCHIPSVLAWPGLEPGVFDGLLYHLDVGATIVELAGILLPLHWDGQSVAGELRAGTDAGRDHLVVSQGAWSVQRGVRFGDHLYLRTWHDGYHPHWNEEMLFDIARDPHEVDDLCVGGEDVSVVAQGRELLEAWTDEQMARSYSPVDPMEIVLAEGGPYHCRGRLPAYLERLRATGRSAWAEVLEQRHPGEL